MSAVQFFARGPTGLTHQVASVRISDTLVIWDGDPRVKDTIQALGYTDLLQLPSILTGSTFWAVMADPSDDIPGLPRGYKRETKP